MKNILVPTDFSDCSRVAEEVGIKLAKKANAEIHFFHIQWTPVTWTSLPLESESLYPETKSQIGYAKSELNRLVKKAQDQGLHAKQFLLFDKGRPEIENHIRHHKHDFIVMGSHGTSGVTELLGSNAQRVVRHSPSPVLVVKSSTKKFDVKNIVFASSFEEDLHHPFLQVIELADLLGAQIHLLYVNQPFNFKETDLIEENIHSFHSKCPRGTCTINIYNALNEERGIQKFAEKINADIIAITTHGKTGFMKMISHSITESLVNHSDIPILSVNAKS